LSFCCVFFTDADHARIIAASVYKVTSLWLTPALWFSTFPYMAQMCFCSVFRKPQLAILAECVGVLFKRVAGCNCHRIASCWLAECGHHVCAPLIMSCTKCCYLKAPRKPLRGFWHLCVCRVSLRPAALLDTCVCLTSLRLAAYFIIFALLLLRVALGWWHDFTTPAHLLSRVTLSAIYLIQSTKPGHCITMPLHSF